MADTPDDLRTALREQLRRDPALPASLVIRCRLSLVQAAPAELAGEEQPRLDRERRARGNYSLRRLTPRAKTVPMVAPIISTARPVSAPTGMDCIAVEYRACTLAPVDSLDALESTIAGARPVIIRSLEDLARPGGRK